MPSDPADALADMLDQMELATQFLAGCTFEAFRGDLKTIYAVTRCLEILSEASRRLPEEVKSRHPDIPWKNIAGAGNVYRHDYEDVAPRLVWETIQTGLPPLLAVVRQELDRLLETGD